MLSDEEEWRFGTTFFLPFLSRAFSCHSPSRSAGYEEEARKGIIRAGEGGVKSQKTVEKFFAHAPAKKPSLSAQQKQDEAEAASDPSAKKRGRKSAAVAVAVVDEEMQQETAAQVAAAAASVPRKAKEECDLVDADCDGNVEAPPDKKARAFVARKEKKVGKVGKTADDFIVNNGGAWLPAKNGRVQINLATVVLVKVTEDAIADCEKRQVVDDEKNAVGPKRYQCLLGGHEFIRVGATQEI
jgi:hypothetical protein